MHDRFVLARMFRRHISEYDNSRNPHRTDELKRLYRQELKKVQGEDPLHCSLLDGNLRRRFDEDGEGVTEYQIIKGSHSPQAIRRVVDEEWITVCSPYDCTGQFFTVDIHATQTPAGLVWIHRKGLDV